MKSNYGHEQATAARDYYASITLPTLARVSAALKNGHRGGPGRGRGCGRANERDRRSDCPDTGGLAYFYPPFRPLSPFVHCSIPLPLPTCVLSDHIRRLNPGTEFYDDKRMLRTRRPRESQRTAPWTQDKQIRLVYRDFLCPLWSPP